MVRRSTRAVRKPRRRVGGKRVARKRIPRTIATNQSAIIKETRAYAPILSNNGYAFTFKLNDFLRASQLAPNFKWYRAVKVEWVMTPLYNVFQDGLVGNEISQPYIYQTMNRTQDALGFSLADIQAMGIKPLKLNSLYKMSYKPNWCSGGLTTYRNAPDQPAIPIVANTHLGLKAEYGYLPCPNNAINAVDIPQYLSPLDPVNPPVVNQGMTSINTNDVVYNGHRLFCQQYNGTGDGQPVAQLTCTVTWVFKDPNNSFVVREPLETVKPLE